MGRGEGLYSGPEDAAQIMPATTRQRTAKEASTPPSTSSENATKPKKKHGGERPGAGRKKDSFKLSSDEKTLHLLEGLGRIQATTKEAAAALDVSEVTFIDFLKREQIAKDTFEKGKADGRVSLRRAQFALALEGNATMQVWLGKNLLGQKDKSEIEHSASRSFVDLLKEINGGTASLVDVRSAAQEDEY